jgi:diguanylate cyclase (GGDEF)-like protein
VYDDFLASEILKALNDAYPEKLGLNELKARLPQLAKANDEWLSAVAALRGDGRITGKFIETGFSDAVQDAALLQITQHGRQAIKAPPSEAGQPQLDPKTNIPNDGKFKRDLEVYSCDARPESPLSLAIVDIDHFKNVNDTYGHLLGDEVLKQVAGALTTGCKNKGKVYRYGGDELTILLPNYTMGEAEALAERLRADINQLRSTPPVVTPSIGVATSPEPIKDINDLFKAADQALYAAKKAGRNQVRTAIKKATAQQHVPLTQLALSVYMRSDDRVRRLDEAISSDSGQPFTPSEDASLSVFDKAKQLGIVTIGEVQDLVRLHGDLAQKLARCMVPVTPIPAGQCLHNVLDITAAESGLERLRVYFRSLRYTNTAAEYAEEFVETLNLLKS